MRVQVPEIGVEYDVKFGKEHVLLTTDEQNRRFFIPVPKTEDFTSIRTHCIISRVENKLIGKDRFIELAHGIATQDTRDKPNKLRGKRESLTKALNELEIRLVTNLPISAKNIRKRFWDTFVKANINDK